MQPLSNRPSILRQSVFILAPVIVLAVAFLVGILIVNRPPKNFPVPFDFTITPGESLFAISHELFAAQAIRSERMFEFWMLLFGSDRNISEGEFYFKNQTSAFTMALRISGKQFGIERKKVTFPEGFTARDMAVRLHETYPNFDTTLFLRLATPYEGYLFPDTYSFFPSVQPDVVVARMRQTFQNKTTTLSPDVGASGRSFEQTIIMASIVEREASGADDRATIAGILWKRIALGKPLQVDAPFSVLLGKDSADLTRTDLALDTPFNTYTHLGLPPTPIANPGLASIEAAIHPVDSPYLFYLHDKNGTIHYARTYTEHLQNVARYLKARN